jgi:chitinase
MKALLALSLVLCLNRIVVAAEVSSPADGDRAQPSTSPPAAAKFAVVGYLPYYQTKTFDPSIGKYLTDLIYFSIEPTEAGDLNHRDISPDLIAQLHKMREQHHTRIEIAVGGWGRAKAMGAVSLDREKRQRFVEQLTKYCDDNKFDGVDFDWEFPRGQKETAAFAELLADCKGAIGPHGRLLTIAVSPEQQLPPAAIQAVDRVHLMSYDHGGPEHSTLAQAEADIKQVLSRGVPTSKLLLGVPFYGRRPKGSPTQMPYAKIVARYHPAARVDIVEGQYYFNGLDTIRAKTRLAKSQQLGGIMFWDIGQDTRDESSLLRAIDDEAAKK